MDYFGYLSSVCFIFGVLQLSSGASLENKYEPMVAFICDRPAMHRGINGWVADKTQDCPDTLDDVLAYCKKIYPDHNITNVVESSSFYDIENWPMGKAGRRHTHHVRPFRCLVGGFQSDALLVPQHCEFDHRADISQCKEFSHWNTVADDECLKKGMHLESFGMLLYCNILGHFNGVEYVCCPNPSNTRVHPEPKGDDKPDDWESEEKDEDDDSEEKSTESAKSSESVDDENSPDVYEAYLRGLTLPSVYTNEHEQYLAAKARMLVVQKKKEAKLLDEFEKTQENVDKVRKTDPKAANKMNEEIADRFKHLYASFKQEDAAEKLQLAALHQRRVQAALNERKREAMDKFMQALEDQNIAKVSKYLHNYIKVEEKDRTHTVNHFEHLKLSDAKEALRVHPHIIRHLKLSEMRIDQALEMMTHYPNVEKAVRPEIEEFMKGFNNIADRIKKVVVPVPEVKETSSYDFEESTSNTNSNDNEYHFDSSSEEQKSDSSPSSSAETVSASNSHSSSNSDSSSSSDNSAMVDDEVQENEHSYEGHHFAANAMADTHSAQHSVIRSSASSSSGLGSTIGIVLGAISVMVIVVVAVVMVRHNKHRQPVSSGYVEVDPSASPEDRYLANMQMNGYENPTYKYFEVQNNPKA